MAQCSTTLAASEGEDESCPGNRNMPGKQSGRVEGALDKKSEVGACDLGQVP